MTKKRDLFNELVEEFDALAEQRDSGAVSSRHRRQK
jgi:hypothetical protein